MERDIQLESFAPQPIEITCLRNETFFIPSYQRGYKWEEGEIKAFLKDIAKYEESRDGKFYCLQPVVIRQDKTNNQWRVVDGQQRLTTIFLILKILEEGKNLFNLEYERDTKLDEYDFNSPKIITSSSEIYHITKAIAYITSWLKDNDSLKEQLRKNLLTHTKVIWYLLDTKYLSEKESQELEHQYFLNLNSGKITLTDAELVKALLLHKPSIKSNHASITNQKYLAEEWDRMERTLRQEDIWYFIAGAKDPMSNSMDFLLELIWKSLPGKIRKNYENTENYIFAWAEDQPSNEVWILIQKAYRVIMGWNSDCTLHNLIGFFSSRKTKSYKIPELLSRSLGFEESVSLTTHSQLKNELWKAALSDNNLICSEYDISTKNTSIFSNTYHKYRYDKEKNSVFDVLLLANIIMVTIGKKPRKFDFYRFNTTSWNVEHISPNHPKSNADLKSKLRNVLDYYTDNTNKTLPVEIQKVEKLFNLFSIIQFNKDYNADLNELAGLSSEQQKDFNSLKKVLIPIEDDDTMIMGNMTLLSEKCNKGIGNNFFFDKKIKIANYQAAGEYVPLLTLNVFTKWYSKRETPAHFWHEMDRQDYLSALDSYFVKIISTL